MSAETEWPCRRSGSRFPRWTRAQILKLADEKKRYRLAISLHAATDELRSKLMPVNRASRSAAHARVVYHIERTGRRVTFEYILLEDLNDSVADASRLVRLVGQIPCKINLIPYNPIGPGKFRRPARAHPTLRDYLSPRVPAVTVRYSRASRSARRAGSWRRY